MKLLVLILKNLGATRCDPFLPRWAHGVGVRGDDGLVDPLAFGPGHRREEENLKAIVTEKWSVPSRMPFSYAATLAEGAAEIRATCAQPTR